MSEIVIIRELLAMLGDASLIVLVVVLLLQTRVLLRHHTRLTILETHMKIKRGNEHGKT